HFLSASALPPPLPTPPYTLSLHDALPISLNDKFIPARCVKTNTAPDIGQFFPLFFCLRHAEMGIQPQVSEPFHKSARYYSVALCHRIRHSLITFRQNDTVCQFLVVQDPPAAGGSPDHLISI